MMFMEKASRCSTKVLMYATLGVASSKIYLLIVGGGLEGGD